MLHDLQLAGLSERTQESYLRAVRKFAQWLKKSPDQASENDLRQYLLFIKNDQQWEGNSLKVAYSGIKFFYGHTWRAALAHAHQAPRPQAAQVAYRVDDSRSRSTHGRQAAAGRPPSDLPGLWRRDDLPGFHSRAKGTIRYQLIRGNLYAPTTLLASGGDASETRFERLPTRPALTVRSGSENRRSLPAPSFTHTPK